MEEQVSCGRFTTSRCCFSGAGDTRSIPFIFSITRLPRHTQTAPALSMAAATSPSSFLFLRLHPLSSFPSSLRRCRRTISTSRCRAMAPIVASIDNTRKEEIVVVGAGIAGLATALSFHRYFISSPFRLVVGSRDCPILMQARGWFSGAGARRIAPGRRHLADAL